VSAAGGIGVWILRKPATEKASRVFDRIEAALTVADENLEQVQISLARAAERLNTAREDQRQLANQPRAADTARRFLARTVQQRIAPEVSNAHDKLHTVAEATVAVNSVLEDLGYFTFFSTTGIDMEGLSEINSRLADVAPAAWELSRLLGEPGSGADVAGPQFSRVEQALNAIRARTAEFKFHLTEVRERTAALKSKAIDWITPAVFLVSLVCLWIALSQLSLLLHARSWWRRAGTNWSK
jgi:hypothetical protein